MFFLAKGLLLYHCSGTSVAAVLAKVTSSIHSSQGYIHQTTPHSTALTSHVIYKPHPTILIHRQSPSTLDSMVSWHLTHYAHTNPLHPSIFPSVTHLPEDRDSYAITKWVTTGYWPWMSESSLQIPANTSAKLAKTPIHEVAVPYQGPSVVKPKRRVSETSTYLAFLHLARDSSISSQNAGEDAAIDTSEETTGSPTVPAPALEEGEIEEESNPRLKRKRSVSSASANALDQELLKLATGTPTSSENADGDMTVERTEATTESLVLSRLAVEEGESWKNTKHLILREDHAPHHDKPARTSPKSFSSM